ncbi:MAG TPA: hypothetical protein VH208_12670 [Myxococcaceae bacterium]|nr:hypothetical protein [Myxococcaceae bacterium]
MDEQPVKKKTSPWVWVGVGCLALIVLIVGGFAIAGFMVYRAGKSFVADMTDPTARAAKVQKILGAQELPEGYHPAFALSLGPLMDMAMLSDRAPKADGSVEGFDKHGFLYMRFPKSNDSDQLRDYLEGKRDDPGMQNNLHLSAKDTLKRGKLELNGETLLYVAQRGEFQSQQVNQQGLQSVMLLECPGDTKTRMAIWFAPDPAPGKKLGPADLAGTPADEGALKDFMSNFKPCQD